VATICMPTQAYVAIGAWDRVKVAFQPNFELGIRDKEESEAVLKSKGIPVTGRGGPWVLRRRGSHMF
jgi:hypothetical protein